MLLGAFVLPLWASVLPHMRWGDICPGFLTQLCKGVVGAESCCHVGPTARDEGPGARRLAPALCAARSLG